MVIFFVFLNHNLAIWLPKYFSISYLVTIKEFPLYPSPHPFSIAFSYHIFILCFWTLYCFSLCVSWVRLCFLLQVSQPLNNLFNFLILKNFTYYWIGSLPPAFCLPFQMINCCRPLCPSFLYTSYHSKWLTFSLINDEKY